MCFLCAFYMLIMLWYTQILSNSPGNVCDGGLRAGSKPFGHLWEHPGGILFLGVTDGVAVQLVSTRTT